MNTFNNFNQASKKKKILLKEINLSLILPNKWCKITLLLTKIQKNYHSCLTKTKTSPTSKTPSLIKNQTLSSKNIPTDLDQQEAQNSKKNPPPNPKSLKKKNKKKILLNPHQTYNNFPLSKKFNNNRIRFNSNSNKNKISLELLRKKIVR